MQQNIWLAEMVFKKTHTQSYILINVSLQKEWTMQPEIIVGVQTRNTDCAKKKEREKD